MADQFKSEQDRLLWAERREALMAILREAFGRFDGNGTTVSETNGWVFDAVCGNRKIQATLNKPYLAYQHPDTVIVMARAFERHGYLPPEPVAIPQVLCTFETDSATLTDVGRSRAEHAVAWLVDCLIEGPHELEKAPCGPGRRGR